MIDRIGNGNIYTSPYDRGGKKAARVEGDAPAFLLPGEENGGVIWDRSPKDDVLKSAVKKEEESGKKKEYADKPETEVQDGITDDIEEYKPSGFGNFIGRLGEAIKNFFKRIWYGDEKKADGDLKTDAADPFAGIDDIENRESRIKTLIADKDEEGLMEELTEGGKKHLAKNTSLLTHYDRRGRLVKPDDSQTGRILSSESGKGGRNVERRPQGNYRRYI